MNYPGRNDITAKILILGESKVGKSSLLLRFTEGIFKETIGPTLGIDYKIKRINIEGCSVNMQLWDTAGQERFKSIVESYYNGAHGIALVFDVSDEGSFDKIKSWMVHIEEKTKEEDRQKMTLCLIGRILWPPPASLYISLQSLISSFPLEPLGSSVLYLCINQSTNLQQISPI